MAGDRTRRAEHLRPPRPCLRGDRHGRAHHWEAGAQPGTVAPRARGSIPCLSRERRDLLSWRELPLWRSLMKAVVIGEPSGASRDAIMAVYPRHKAVVDRFISRGVVLAIGPFTDGGNMAIFK